MPWQSAHDLATKWDDADPRDRPRQPKDAPALTLCSQEMNLGNGTYGPCPERFTSREALDFHRAVDHDKLIDLKPYSREPTGRDDPMFSDFGGIDRGKALRERPGDTPRGMRRKER